MSPKYSFSSRVLFISFLLPLTLKGCSTAGGLFGDGDDYIDYTTDHLKQAEPEIASALTGLEFRDRNQLEFDFYASAGLGFSQLQPDTSTAIGFDVDEEFGAAGQFTLGLDINKHFSVELHSADLGSAGLSPFGRINYHLNGLSALYYIGGNRHNYGRHGFNGFARLGVAKLENSTNGNISFERVNDTQVLFGAGMEYNTRFGIGLRAEAIAFDTDAQYAQLGITYRFGKQKPARKVAIAPVAPPAVTVAAVEPERIFTPKPVARVEPALAAARAPIDNDNDGIPNTIDQCRDTASNITVDNKGCALFSGTLEGVNFPSNSAKLTNTATYILNGVSHTLAQHPDTNILVIAHTDSNGNSDQNQLLSEERAKTVVNYLARKGIPYSQMSARAYGERKPISTNSTADGRASNRRIELFATNRQIKQK